MQPFSILHFLVHLRLLLSRTKQSPYLQNHLQFDPRLFSGPYVALFSVNLINTFFCVLYLVSLNLVKQGLFVYFLPVAFHMKSENCKLKKCEPKKRRVGLKILIFFSLLYIANYIYLSINISNMTQTFQDVFQQKACS